MSRNRNSNRKAQTRETQHPALIAFHVNENKHKLYFCLLCIFKYVMPLRVFTKIMNAQLLHKILFLILQICISPLKHIDNLSYQCYG